jgi:two-component system, cell cycle sensor histidine kinase and response regulator CckA
MSHEDLDDEQADEIARLKARMQALEQQNSSLKASLKNHEQILLEEQNKASEQLLLEQRFTQSVLESLPGIFYLVSEDLVLVRSTKRLGEATGYSPAELKELPITKLFPRRAEGDSAIAAVKKVFDTGTANLEASIGTKTGETIPYFFSGQKITIEGKSYLSGLGFDITERHGHKQALKASEERYGRLIEIMNEGLIVRDRNGLITYVNGRLCRLLGFTRQDMIGQNMSAFLSETNLVIMKTKLTQSRDGNLGAYEIDWKTKAGKRVPTLVSEQLLFNDRYQYDGSIAIITDITKRKFLEEQLRQSQKMEAVGLLAGGIAHDFNNLLTGIIGYSELTLLKMGPHDPLLDDVDRILQSGKKARDLTQQLLAFSRKQVLRIKVLNLNSIVQKIEKILRRIIGEDVKLETRLVKDLWSVKADPAQIEQILMNLAVNARDAMPSGGTLIIETRNKDFDFVQAEQFHDLKAGSYITLSVRDTGCGMDEETQQHIFEPFFTTKEVGKGTGLGLSTVYGIVRQHDGQIQVETETQKGTSFHVHLPGFRDHPTDQIPTLKSRAFDSKGETILVVEDEEMVRKLACRILGAHKYTVLQASNATEALALAINFKEKIHLLLTDVVMPGLSGRELYEQLVRERPVSKVVYMSGYTRNFIDPHGVLDPDIPFLQKPFTVDSLLRKVREVLGA